MKIRLKSDAKTLESMPCDRPLIIGRRDGCELPIQDRSVSRQHAELAYRKNDGWYLRDLGSRFGTQVNGLPISAPIRLNEGDHITLGKLPFTVSLASDEDTGYNTTGVAVAIPPAAAPAPPSARPAPLALPGQDTSPVARVASDANMRQSRRRIIRIPMASSLDSTVRLLAVLGFAAVLLIVAAILFRGREAAPPAKTANEPSKALADRGTTAPPVVVVPVPPVLVEPDATADAPAAPPKRPPAARRGETSEEPPVAVEPAPAAPAATVPPARRVRIFRPTMPDGDLEAEKAENAAATAASMPEMPQAAAVATAANPDVELLRNQLAAQVQSGANLHWEVTLNEKATRYSIRAADATGVRMSSPNGEMSLAWDRMGNEGLYKLFHPLLPGAPPNVLAAWLRIGATLNRSADPSYQQQLGILREKDADAARAIEAELKAPAVKPDTVAGAGAAVKLPDTPAATTPTAATTPATAATAAGATVPPAGPAAPKGWGETGPEIKPTLLMLARVGGAGDQWIKSVAVKGSIVAAAGEGDFQVSATVAPDGAVRAKVTGNVSGRHEPWGVLPAAARARTATGVEYGSRQVHPVLQQPFLASGAAWKLWGWTYDQARTSKAPFAPFMADSGIRNAIPMPNGDLMVVGMSEGGNTSLRAHPKDIHVPLEFPIATGGGAGKSSFLFEVTPAGEPVRQMVLRGSANTACWDAWGRMLVAGRGLLRGAPNAFEYPDGAGILLADVGWQKILFGTSIGAEGEGDVSLVGIDVDPASGLAAAVGYVEGEIKQVRPLQEKAGGGKDGLLVIFSLWGSYGRPAAGGAK